MILDARSGLWVPEPKAVLEAVDLFCGAGGFSLGLEMAGIDVVGAVENDPSAAMTYLYNLGSPRGCAVAYVSDDDQRRFRRALSGCAKRRRGIDDVVPGDHGWIGFARPRGGAGPLGYDTGCRGMVFGDARQIDGETILATMGASGWSGSIDLVCGGPPCQGMSKCNSRRSPVDPRNDLTAHFVRIADELGAGVWVMENVAPLVTDEKFRPVLMGIVETACERGYRVAANVVDAVNYGVPQYRRRAILIGSRDGARIPSFPMPTHWSTIFDLDGRVVTNLGRLSFTEEDPLEETEQLSLLS